MRLERKRTDITVVGGGLAGINAAIAAARLGKTVALIQNRPVLGGNSSSEVRVWVVGATSHGVHRYARENGIMGEMYLENQYANPEGNPYYWDLVLLEMVRAEPNIELFLNTDVHEVEADGDAKRRTIRTVTGWMMGSERKITFESDVFIDCTGDGLVGFLAGAEYRIGREARSEFQEDWAPEVADQITLGSTLLFYTKSMGRSVKFVPPSFAKDITKTSIPLRRVIKSGDNGCFYWWIEWGGEKDTVHNNEEIRDELWAVIYGIWDYIKNSGQFDSDDMMLEWVGSVPGKREYRRFVGDYMLNQNDILEQRQFDDRIAFGGWSIDLHPSKGVYAEEDGSKHLHSDGIYHIPFGSLYSANVTNMLMAGRNISASHVAFGTTRVMATCAVIGEAAGTAAALCVEKQMEPRQLAEQAIEELQQVLLRQDAAVLGLRNQDKLDMARTAIVRASSEMKQLQTIDVGTNRNLTTDAGLLIPMDPGMDSIEILLDCKRDTILEAELWHTGLAENYVPAGLITTAAVTVSSGERQWVTIPLSWHPDVCQNGFIVLKANDVLAIYQAETPVTGVLAFAKQKDTPIVDPSLAVQPAQPVSEWNMKGMNRNPYCFRLHRATAAFAAEKVINGYRRPYGGPHMWVSEVLAANTTTVQAQNGKAWIELSWEKEVAVQQVHIIFNDDVNEDLINLHRHRTPFDVIPELVKDYRIEAMTEHGWEALCQITNNRKRKRVHQLPKQVNCKQLRLVVEQTNGSPRAEVIEIRVYE